MLLAQTAATPSWIWFPILACVGTGFLLLVVIVLAFLQAARSRRLLHLERMRASEAGIPWEPVPETAPAEAKFMHNAFWIAFWLATSPSAAAFAAASQATQHSDRSLPLAIVVWGGAALASIASVICATVLMIYSRSGQLGGIFKRWFNT